MKTASSLDQRILLAMSVVAVSGISLLPMTVTADTAKTTAACTRIATLASSSSSTIASHIATMQSDFANRLTKISATESSVDKQVSADRATASANFETKVKAMESKAGLTPVQLKAVQVYEANMVAANSTREAAVDAARSTYRTALLADVTNRQSQLSGSVDTYKAAVNSAFATAASNCGDGTAVATLRTTVATAHQSLNSARQSDKIAADIKQLAATRTSAIAAADKIFATAAATDTAALVAVLNAV